MSDRVDLDRVEGQLLVIRDAEGPEKWSLILQLLVNVPALVAELRAERERVRELEEKILELETEVENWEECQAGCPM